MSATTATLPADPEPPEQRRADMTTIGVVGLAHGISHFFHLLAAPLFPWLKAEFALSYAELGLVMSVFFVVSGIGQACAGFVVDRFSARPVLYAGLALFVAAALVMAASTSYTMLLVGAALAGLGNCVFHPVDYSILNARISKERLGHAYSFHGITGSLGWAAAAAFMGGLAALTSWRMALVGAAVLAAAVLAVCWWFRAFLDDSALRQRAAVASAAQVAGGGVADSSFGFLKLPAVWFSFAFFFAYAVALGGVQSFAGEAARQLHDMPAAWGALVLTLYMVASAAGMVGGGFLVRNPERCEKVITAGFGGAAVCALVIGLTGVPGWAVLLLVAAMGFAAGTAAPARDMLVKRAAPPNATGRVYGVVYSGLDVGMALAPTLFGAMMDRNMPVWVWIGVAFFQAVLIVNALRVGVEARVNAARGARGAQAA